MKVKLLSVVQAERRWFNMSEKIKVLVVDDDKFTRDLHAQLLSQEYAVLTAEDAKEALDIIGNQQIALAFLDIKMPLVHGITLCKKIKEITNIPIIFITGTESLDEHIKAYEAGGDDLLTKPAAQKVLMMKAKKLLDSYRDKEELSNLESMTYSFMSSLGTSEILLSFMKNAVLCKTKEEIINCLLKTTLKMNLDCIALFNIDEQETVALNSNGTVNEIEKRILILSRNSGKVFQFKQKVIFNYNKISLLCHNIPLNDEKKSEEVKEILMELVETTDNILQNFYSKENLSTIDSNIDGKLQQTLDSIRVSFDSLKSTYEIEIMEVSYLLEELVRSVEKTYSWLGINQEQEEEIGKILRKALDGIYSALNDKSKFDKELKKITSVLEGKK